MNSTSIKWLTIFCDSSSIYIMLPAKKHFISIKFKIMYCLQDILVQWYHKLC